jgi:hypothetical protein
MTGVFAVSVEAGRDVDRDDEDFIVVEWLEFSFWGPLEPMEHLPKNEMDREKIVSQKFAVEVHDQSEAQALGWRTNSYGIVVEESPDDMAQWVADEAYEAVSEWFIAQAEASHPLYRGGR